MEFHENHLYHIYNRGNNKQKIFFNEGNYLFFLRKIRQFILPNCDLLSYCLMPNHFHILIYISEEKNQLHSQSLKSELKSKHRLSIGIASLLSSYTQAINNQNGSTGSLFQQKTKAKCLNDGNLNYAPTCFHYIHQNPVKAGIVQLMENWEYSSFKDYAGLRNGSLCNKELAYQLLDLRPDSFYEDSYKMIAQDKTGFIF